MPQLPSIASPLVGGNGHAGRLLRVRGIEIDWETKGRELMEEVSNAVHARDKKVGKPYVYPQVALIALNPHTGQVLAMVGGRSYGTSQVNHAVAHRPTGSIFKPFVYAAAFQTAVEGTMLPGQEQTVLAGNDVRRRAEPTAGAPTTSTRRATRGRVLRRHHGALRADAVGQ